MSRATYVFRKDKRGRIRLVDKRRAAPLNARTDPRMYVIGDVMDPAKHMATGRIHDSKAKFRADTRAAGCVEAGNDPALRRPAPSYRPPDLLPYVQRAIQTLESR